MDSVVSPVTPLLLIERGDGITNKKIDFVELFSQLFDERVRSGPEWESSVGCEELEDE